MTGWWSAGSDHARSGQTAAGATASSGPSRGQQRWSWSRSPQPSAHITRNFCLPLRSGGEVLPDPLAAGQCGAVGSGLARESWKVERDHSAFPFACCFASMLTGARGNEAHRLHRLTRVSSHPFQQTPLCHRNIPPSGFIYICTYTIVAFAYINHHASRIPIFVCNQQPDLKIRGLHPPLAPAGITSRALCRLCNPIPKWAKKSPREQPGSNQGRAFRRNKPAFTPERLSHLRVVAVSRAGFLGWLARLSRAKQAPFLLFPRRENPKPSLGYAYFKERHAVQWERENG
jgi:hypothetical protein